MKTNQLIEVFEANANPENAVKQKAYLKNQFEFLGIAKPARAKLERDFIKSTKLIEKEEVINIIFEVSKLGFREYLYTSQMIMQANYKRFSYKDVLDLTAITRDNQWWENTDGFQSFLKKWFRDNPEYIKPFVLEFYQDENMWMRRLAIIAQLGMRDLTDFEIMKRAIKYNLKYDEFFIQKAIGWALRDYSKVNKTRVSEFIDSHQSQLSSLAIREGSKYL